jgi:hypothetical protein
VRPLPALLLAFLLAAPLSAPVAASALQIRFEAEDLADPEPGSDLWRIRYRPSDLEVVAFRGFSVFFDPALARGLQDPPPAPSAAWDAITLQPDLALPADGVYDVIALVAAASLDADFVLDFVWLGGAGGPGAQPFSVNQFDAQGNLLAVLATGSTVPEPSSALLAALGLALLGGARRARGLAPPARPA